MEETTVDQLPRKTRDSYQKAVAALERGNVDYAVDILFNILDLQPGFQEARRLLRAAQIRKAGGKTSPLQHIINNITQIGSVLTVNSLLKSKPDKALKAAEKLLKADPLNKTFLMLHARAAQAAEFMPAAIHSMEVAREHYPKDVAVLNQLAEMYADNDQISEAKDCYEFLLSLKPNDPQILKKMKDTSALETMQRGRWEEEGDYRNKLKDEGESKRLEQASRAVKTDSDIDTLIEEAKAKAEKDPENLNYRRGLADLYVRAHRYDDALQVLEEAQAATGGGDPQIDRAMSNTRLKKIDAHIEELQKVGDTAGVEQAQKERGEYLLKDAADRVKRYPNDLLFKFEYGVLLYENGRVDEAIQQFQPAQRNPQKRIRTLYYLALCFKQKNQFDIAAEQLEKAASELFTMDETKKDIIYELGLLNESMGNIDKAVEYFKQIYAVDISYREVSQKIEQAYKKKEA